MKFVDGINIPERENFRQSVEADLKDLGIKLTREREEKQSLKTITGTLFGNYLSNLPLTVVQQNDLTLEVPSFLVKSFEFIGANIQTEGIFRKAGSVQRQRELKRCLENDGRIQNCDVHDVANLVKQFLRSLPSPLIHSRLHDPLLKAFDSGNSLSILLLCALMQFVHLHTLRYVMTFFTHVSQNSEITKMNAHNLAVVLTPNIFSKCETKFQKDKGKILQKETALIQWFIEHSHQIGLVPDHLFNQFKGFRSFLLNDVPLTANKSKRAKKRNSLNGMISEIRRRVHPNRALPLVTDNGELFDDTAELIPLSTYKQTPSIYKPTTTKYNSSPSIAIKRKSNESSSSQSEIPEKSPRCENACAFIHHIDSPTPDEATVSAVPQVEHHVEAKIDQKEHQKGLGGKMKMFGKNYLKRRNSLDHIVKPVPSVVEKKIAETNFVQRVGRRINGEKKSFISSPSLPNIRLPIDHPTKLRSSPRLEPGNLKNLASKLKNEEKISTQARISNLKKRKTTDKQFRSDDNISVEKMRKVSIKRTVSEGDEIRQNESQVGSNLVKVKEEQENENNERDFTKPINFNRSLRRGRPNTVNTGLPLESPFKPTKNEICMIEYSTPFQIDLETPADADSSARNRKLRLYEDSEMISIASNVKQALKFDEESTDNIGEEILNLKPLIKSDSGIFSEFEEVKETMDFVEEEEIKVVNSKLSVVESMDCSFTEKGEETTNTEPLRRKSISLNNIRENVNSVGLNERTQSEENVDRDIKWESANVFVSRELKQESMKPPSSGLGRPSIIQLLKEKSGTVTATAKQYDAISINGNSPLLNSTSVLMTTRVNSLKLSDKQFATPVKIPGVFSNQTTPLRSKFATPCADRTNSNFDPVFKTPLLRSTTRCAKENSSTPKARRNCGITKELKTGINKSNSTRRSNSFDKCGKASSSVRKSPRLQTVENRRVRRRLSSTRRRSSTSSNGSAL